MPKKTAEETQEELVALEFRDDVPPAPREVVKDKCSNHPDRDSVVTETHDNAHSPQYFCRDCALGLGYSL